jgi:hypothetical protein
MNRNTADALGITHLVTVGPARGYVSRFGPTPGQAPMREYPVPTRENAPNPLEPVLRGPVGALGRAIAGTIGGPGTVLTPVRTAAPYTQMGRHAPADDAILDRNGNVIGHVHGAFADAMDTAVAAARAKVNQDARNYPGLPAVPRNLAEAIMVYILLMWSAKSENPKNAATYKAAEDVAAYKYRDASPLAVLDAAIFLADNKTPRTNAVARDIRKRFVAAPPAAKPAAKSTKHRSRTSASATVESPPPVEDSPWYASLPEWAPTAAVAVGIGVVALVLLPKRAAA